MTADEKVENFCVAISGVWETAAGSTYPAYETWGAIRGWCHGAAMMLDLDDEFDARDDLYLLRDIAAQYEYERSGE